MNEDTLKEWSRDNLLINLQGNCQLILRQLSDELTGTGSAAVTHGTARKSISS